MSVIIPAFNEEQAVKKVLDDVRSQEDYLLDLGCDLEVLVIDNNSTDSTARLAEMNGATVIKEVRQGYGHAHKKGIALSRGDFIVTLDCDDTYPASDIPLFIKRLQEGLGFITTNRLESANKDSMSLTSVAGNSIFKVIAKILYGSKTPVDTQSGMWAFRREAVADLLGLGNGMELSQQLKLRLARTHKWLEIPIDYTERIGESKLRPIKDGARVLFHLVTARF